MVLYRRLFAVEAIPLLMTLMVIIATVDSTKIAYKKTINGKVQVVKAKPLKPKATEETTPTVAPTPSTSVDATTSITSTVTPFTSEPTLENTEKPTESDTTLKAVDHIEQIETSVVTTDEIVSVVPEIISKEIEKSDPVTELPENHIEEEEIVVDETLVVEHISELTDNGAEHIEEPSNSLEQPTNSTTESTYVETTTANKRPVPCTCGVFMTSQIKRTGNPYEQPMGIPVITNELDRVFPCNAVGQKQCQTKCLEAIVQHLPNSATILCATLDRDIRKERAYLYIKNCRNQWYNTNLAAGREYCCKNGQPYQCPLV